MTGLGRDGGRGVAVGVGVGHVSESVTGGGALGQSSLWSVAASCRPCSGFRPNPLRNSLTTSGVFCGRTISTSPARCLWGGGGGAAEGAAGGAAGGALLAHCHTQWGLAVT